ncbi:MAG: helix-turn-helix domain-containing protein [Verrucomicrobia bacterium]|nr:helix-turn-helix domain-containing protein [Verrucomicrobiota bacterium]
MNLSTKIKNARKRAGLSQKAAASAWGVKLATLRAWEQDRNTPRGLALAMLEQILAQQPGTTASKSSRTKG